MLRRINKLGMVYCDMTYIYFVIENKWEYLFFLIFRNILFYFIINVFYFILVRVSEST